MKTLITVFAILWSVSNLCAQTIGSRIEQKINNRVNNKIDRSIDKVLDKSEKTIDDAAKPKDEKKSTQKSKNSKNSSVDNNNVTSPSPSAQKNSDFVSGSKTIFADDFSVDPIGDFPVKWNTNGSGAVAAISSQNGQWLSISHNTIVNPELAKAIPANATVEFDLFLMDEGNGSIPQIDFGLTPVKNILKEDLYYKDKFYVRLGRYNERDGQFVEYGLKDLIGNKNNFPLTKYKNRVLHVAMAINTTRIRVYLDGEKLIDLPKALTPEMRNNFFINNVYTVPASETGVYVSNFRIAEAQTDARSSLVKDLMEQGKASTSDILFSVNKDDITPASFPIIDEVGNALKQNGKLKIKIVGHTDSDGDAAANKTLSEKRAEAVKNYLRYKFNIEGERIVTEGKGEESPIASNSTADGKAKNRRVEFIKL